MILTVTAAAKAVGVSRTTLYEKIKDGTLSRTSDGIDTSELLRVFGQLKSNDKSEAEAPAVADDGMAVWLRNKLDAAELEADQLRDELADTQARLAEHRDNAKLLEDKSNEWQQALAERQSEIESARRESVELSERLQSEQSERAKAEQLAKQLQGRGLFARLMNRQPETI